MRPFNKLQFFLFHTANKYQKCINACYRNTLVKWRLSKSAPPKLHFFIFIVVVVWVRKW